MEHYGSTFVKVFCDEMPYIDDLVSRKCKTETLVVKVIVGTKSFVSKISVPPNCIVEVGRGEKISDRLELSGKCEIKKRNSRGLLHKFFRIEPNGILCGREMATEELRFLLLLIKNRLRGTPWSGADILKMIYYHIKQTRAEEIDWSPLSENTTFFTVRNIPTFPLCIQSGNCFHSVNSSQQKPEYVTLLLFAVLSNTTKTRYMMTAFMRKDFLEFFAKRNVGVQSGHTKVVRVRRYKVMMIENLDLKLEIEARIK